MSAVQSRGTSMFDAKASKSFETTGKPRDGMHLTWWQVSGKLYEDLGIKVSAQTAKDDHDRAIKKMRVAGLGTRLVYSQLPQEIRSVLGEPGFMNAFILDDMILVTATDEVCRIWEREIDGVWVKGS